ncbi:MAG: orotidine-5'-phosphate decarboxylase [Myxococcota bacterium]
MSNAGRDRLIFALDLPTLAEAEAWCARMAPEVGLFKVGLELFAAAGPAAVRAASQQDRAGVFLDLKLHDIPTTVERATRAVRALGARMLSVHAQGGTEMMRAASRAAGDELCVLAVTRLTSQTAEPDEVVGLSRLAVAAGCGGIVCAGREVAAVRKAVGEEATLVCPGVRPRGADPQDQKRVVTPADAILAGANYVVIGRPLRDAPDPVEAARAVSRELARALGD